MMNKDRADLREKSGINYVEFIFLVGALTSIIALAIDTVLPALLTIGDDFSLSNPNHPQLVIVVFALSFGLTQIIFGPLTDSLGRKLVMYLGLSIFVIASFAAAVTDSFAMLIFLRALQGAGAAAVRVSTMATVRDCFGGRNMASVISLMTAVLLIVPVVAPAIGQIILSLADWHWIFILFGVFGAMLALWAFVRLKETHSPENRRPLQFKRIMAAFREIVTNRLAFGYTIASTLLFACLFAFLTSIPQIIEIVFERAHLFAAIFAIIGITMAIGSVCNSFVVQRIGMRKTSHAAIVSLCCASAVYICVAYFTDDRLITSLPLMALIMLSFNFAVGNFNAIALEPLAHIAGSASAVYGMVTFAGGSVLGGLVGQQFNGTVLPLAIAFLAFGIAGLTTIYHTEKGVLFGD